MPAPAQNVGAFLINKLYIYCMVTPIITTEQLRYYAYRFTVSANDKKASIIYLKPARQFILGKDLVKEDYLTEAEHAELAGIILASTNPSIKEILQLT